LYLHVTLLLQSRLPSRYLCAQQCQLWSPTCTDWLPAPPTGAVLTRGPQWAPTKKGPRLQNQAPYKPHPAQQPHPPTCAVLTSSLLPSGSVRVSAVLWNTSRGACSCCMEAMTLSQARRHSTPTRMRVSYLYVLHGSKAAGRYSCAHTVVALGLQQAQYHSKARGQSRWFWNSAAVLQTVYPLGGGPTHCTLAMIQTTLLSTQCSHGNSNVVVGWGLLLIQEAVRAPNPYKHHENMLMYVHRHIQHRAVHPSCPTVLSSHTALTTGRCQSLPAALGTWCSWGSWPWARSG
jgi:hypothetical protein